MRRIIPILTMVIILAGSTGSSFAQFYQEDARLWYIPGSIGVAGQDLGDVEKALRAEKQALIRQKLIRQKRKCPELFSWLGAFFLFIANFFARFFFLTGF